MLTLFFIIIFIAELIITSWIVSIIRIADQKVCQANQQVTESRKKLKERLYKIKAIINIANLSIDYIITYIKETKTSFEQILNKDIITTLILLILKIPENKISKCINIFMIIKNAYSKIFT